MLADPFGDALHLALASYHRPSPFSRARVTEIAGNKRVQPELYPMFEKPKRQFLTVKTADQP